MPEFTAIPPAFLASIASDNERIPTLYYAGNPLLRHMFWLRLRWLYQLAQREAPRRRTCLDFGGGGGVFLPSLAGLFEQVVSIDLEVEEAVQVVDHFGLDNVSLVRADATRAELDQSPFDVIVAADVLEHFRDLAPPVAALQRWLEDDGVLLTSLPSESGFYDRLRRVFGVEPPEDHYHTGFAVERFLAENGFRRIRRWCVPLVVPIAPVFLVSAWRRAGSPAR